MPRATLPLTDAPQVTWPGDQQTLLGAPVSLQLVATGGAGQITWTADSLPHGLTCTATGLISGVPAPGGPALQFVTVTATDANLASGSASFSWTTAAQGPDVLGMKQVPAIAELRAAGFTDGPATLSNQCLGKAGFVVGRSHPAGDVLPEGTEIRLTTLRRSRRTRPTPNAPWNGGCSPWYGRDATSWSTSPSGAGRTGTGTSS